MDETVQFDVIYKVPKDIPFSNNEFYECVKFHIGVIDNLPATNRYIDHVPECVSVI